MGTIMTLEGQGVTVSEPEEGAGGLIASGDVYLASLGSNIANNGTFIFHLAPAFGRLNIDMYAKIKAKLEGVGLVELYEDPSLTAGLPGGVFNVLNSSTGRIIIPNIAVSSDPGIDLNGTLLAQEHIGANQPAVMGPTYLNTGAHEYLIVLTNLSGGAARGSIEVSWSEVS